MSEIKRVFIELDKDMYIKLAVLKAQKQISWRDILLAGAEALSDNK